MDLKSPREVYGMFLVVRVAGMPGKTSMSGNGWSLEEIPAEEEILACWGGSPGRPGRKPWAAGEEALGGRGGSRWAAGEASWKPESSSRGPPWGGPR